MIRILLLFGIVGFLLFPTLVLAQAPIEITGSVVESVSKDPVPYASVVVRTLSEDKVITGTTTGEDGTFLLRVNHQDFWLEISFIGFETLRIDSLSVRNGNMNLGVIPLKEKTQRLNEVEVSAERSRVEFKLDKRVFNVGQDIASTGVGALDVLNKVPSVNVDIEGQVTLRGNSGVQILINGKPSVLSDDGSNLLSTLTADMIERIEVITNPSAKYEAEGSSGIINIVLKKEEKKGFNGSISANTGIPANHSIGVSLNRRTENFNFFTQLGGGYRSLPRYGESTNLDLVDSTEVKSEGIEYRNEKFFNIKIGRAHV